MLIRRVLTVLLVAVGLASITSSPARADAGCDPGQSPWCQVDGSGDGTPGGGGNGGGGGCTWQGVAVPCQDPDLGYYAGGGCYYKPADPPPLPPRDATGGWYVRSCLTAPGSGVVTLFLAWVENPPAGPTPAQLAQQALAKIHLLGARIGLAPDPGGSGLVGNPVWMWTAVTAQTWGPQTATATGGAITVTLTAQATRIVWDMGNGHSVSCDNPGTPYTPNYGRADSPDCGYRYTTASTSPGSPHSRYHVTATTYWTVIWNGGGQTGVLNPTSVSQSSVEIQELQVVTQ